MSKLWNEVVAHRKAVLLTFEIFWIVVFLLDAASGPSGAAVAPFVYANF